MTELPEKTLQDAYEWHARAVGGDLNPEERTELETWLDRDQSHRVAFERAELLWRKLGQIRKRDYPAEWFARIAGYPRSSSAGMPESLLRLFSVPKILTLTGGAIAAVLLAVLYLSNPQEIVEPTRYSTAVAEIRDVGLEDGTVVSLGAESRIDVVFDEGRRELTLVAGEAYFDVAPDGRRPFTVEAGLLRVTVVGTEFALTRTATSTELAVSEGVVSVEPGARSGPDDAAAARELSAGEQVRGESTGLSPVLPVDVREIGAWRRGEWV